MEFMIYAVIAAIAFSLGVWVGVQLGAAKIAEAEEKVKADFDQFRSRFHHDDKD